MKFKAMKDPEIVGETQKVPYLFKVRLPDDETDKREFFYFFGQFRKPAKTIEEVLTSRGMCKIFENETEMLFMKKEVVPGDNVLSYCLLETKRDFTVLHFYLIPTSDAVITIPLASYVKEMVCNYLEGKLDCVSFPLRFGTCP
ncbi:hypothetical protein ACFLZC_00155 [Patescibacteria group bacterium]